MDILTVDMVKRVGSSLIVAVIIGTVGWVWAIQAQVSYNERTLELTQPQVKENEDKLDIVQTDIAVIRERVTAQTATVQSMNGKLDVLLLETRRANGASR